MSHIYLVIKKRPYIVYGCDDIWGWIWWCIGRGPGPEDVQKPYRIGGVHNRRPVYDRGECCCCGTGAMMVKF